ncbi:ABC transporter substrate-binding protein [Mycolicibacterium tusciae]|uniref:ABC transporter substrate-binding protein n=1 Tax=Mycolicibacterium tusciae TaxID=75922 RepID=UPI00024A2EDA|nr:ABC transporter substrate-binding protein [Mycolicibacterium tusciae]
MRRTFSPQITRHTRALLAAAVGVFILVGCSNASSDSTAPEAKSAESFTVVDDQGRELTFDGPVERAVIVGSFNVDLALALGARDQIVGIDSKTIGELNYADFSDDLSVGANGTELNYESIAEKNPDVVFIYRNHDWADAAAQLDKFGIPVVVASTWVFSEWNKSIDLLATVLGRKQEAAAVHQLTTDIDDLLARTKNVAKIPTYYEDSKGATTGADGGKNFALQAAGVENIFGTTPGNVIDSDPAAVLSADPGLIVVETSNTYGGSSDGVFQTKADELLARPGWADLAAVRDGKLFLYNAWAFDIAGNQITPLFYAKWAYPDLFADVDPFDFVARWAHDFIGAKDFSPEDGYVYRVDSGPGRS